MFLLVSVFGLISKDALFSSAPKSKSSVPKSMLLLRKKVKMCLRG